MTNDTEAPEMVEAQAALDRLMSRPPWMPRVTRQEVVSASLRLLHAKLLRFHRASLSPDTQDGK